MHSVKLITRYNMHSRVDDVRSVLYRSAQDCRPADSLIPSHRTVLPEKALGIGTRQGQRGHAPDGLLASAKFSLHREVETFVHVVIGSCRMVSGAPDLVYWGLLSGKS